MATGQAQIQGRRKRHYPLVARKPVEERFLEKVFADPNSGCWLWTGALDSHGYGQLAKPGKNNGIFLAHRLSWALHHDVSADGLLVCHKCDVPSCVNPSHLFLGTNDDNTKDKISKGRQPSHVGANNPKAKLTADMVREIKASTLPRLELARLFGVSRTHIGYIQRGVSWSVLHDKEIW